MVPQQEDTKVCATMETEDTNSDADTGVDPNIDDDTKNTNINNIFYNRNENGQRMFGDDYIFDTGNYGIYEIPFLKERKPYKTSRSTEKTTSFDHFSGFDPLFEDAAKVQHVPKTASLNTEQETKEFFENLGRRLEESLAEKPKETDLTIPVDIPVTEENAVDEHREFTECVCDNTNFFTNDFPKNHEELIIKSNDEELKALKEEIVKVENLILELNIMSQFEKTDITSDVFTTSEFKYLIKRNNVEYAFADEMKVAVSIVNSVANDEVKKLTTDGTHVFLRADREGCRVQIYTQAIGFLMNSGISKNTVFEIVPVRKIFFVRPDPVGFSKEEVKRFIPEKQ